MRYKALALQTTCHAVNGFSDASESQKAISFNIQTIGKQIRASKTFVGSDLKLVVLPGKVKPVLLKLTRYLKTFCRWQKITASTFREIFMRMTTISLNFIFKVVLSLVLMANVS